MRKIFLFLLLAFAMCLQTTTARTIKILAIGNSFSEDAIVQYPRTFTQMLSCLQAQLCRMPAPRLLATT